MTTSPLDDRREVRTDDVVPLVRRQPTAPADADHRIQDALSVRRLTDAQRSEQTAELLARAHAAGVSPEERAACLDRVVELNMRVAEAVARRYARKSIPVEDLTQVAYLALVRAVRSFDPSHERDLLSYAVPSMTGEIRRHFRDHSWTIRPPREVQRAHGRLVRSGASLDRVDEASVSALADEVEESVDVVREALAARSCFSLLSLDTPPGAEGGEGEASVLREVGDPGHEADVARTEARLVVAPLLRTLSPRERDLLRLRFADELPQREIASRLGMSQIQVSRLLQRLLLQLRGALAEAC
ncbi:sigma-70 family RNA polymerase sigma factor [Nocardioides sp.]|uniref:sigma-70 family RNA polymerase sigma factor n=1 Tax=Nocardioides sp. TaxID=35761 RepID=UPI00261EFE9B|nr:sigma-70 family RNA polymerase sigma factor [Nocardioides sp.]